MWEEKGVPLHCAKQGTVPQERVHSPKVKLEHWVHVLPPSVEVNACIEASVAKGDKAAGIREKKGATSGCPLPKHRTRGRSQ